MRLRDDRPSAPLRTQRTIEASKDRKRLWFGVLLFVICVVSCAGAFYGAKKLVVVSEIVFSGNQHMKAGELQGLMRLRKGDELFAVSGAEIRARLLKSPWVKDAVVRKEPVGRVLVHVFEAVPLAVLEMQGRSVLVDREGVLLEDLRAASPVVLPVLRIDPVQARDAYLEALAFVEVVRSKRVMSSTGNFVLTGARPEELTLHLEQTTVKIGSGEFERKLADLQFVKEEIAKRNIRVEYIDLRFANRIVVKPIQHEAADTGTLEEKQKKHAKKKH